MKALSVRQPWADLIATGQKTIEVRSKRTTYRGPLLICAGGGWHKLGVSLHGRRGARGVTICTVELVDCRPLVESDSEAAGGIDPAIFAGQFAWVLAGARYVRPIPFLGQLGVFNPPQEVVQLLHVA